MENWYDWNGFRVEVIESDEGEKYCRFELPIREIYQRFGSFMFLDKRNKDYVPEPTGLQPLETLTRVIPQEQDFLDYKALRDEYSSIEKMADEPAICNDYGNMSWEDRVIVQDGKKGLCDFLGKVVVPAMFDEVQGAWIYEEASDPKFLAKACKDGKWALVRRDGNGTPVTEFVYEQIENDWGWYYAVRNDRAGLISSHSGKEMVPCEMTRLFARNGGTSFFMKGEKWGFLSYEIGYIAPEYDEFKVDTSERKDFFEDSLFLKVRKGEEWGYIDAKGRFTADIRKACLEASLPDMRDSHRYFGDRLPKEVSDRITAMQNQIHEADRKLMRAELDKAIKEGKIPEGTKLPFDI